MKVISRGKIPEEQLYRTSCQNCKSILEFHKHETQVLTDRNDVVYILVCPVCSKDIVLSVLKPVVSIVENTDFRDRPYSPK